MTFCNDHQDGVHVLVDNTFLSAYFCRPLELGADLTYYSLTKYMNGHSDVIMGAVSTNKVDLGQKLRWTQNCAGSNIRLSYISYPDHHFPGVVIGHFNDLKASSAITGFDFKKIGSVTKT